MNVLVIGANWGKVVADGFRQHGCKVLMRGRDWNSRRSFLSLADAVAVCVPPLEQTLIVAAALQAGKHVLCEKPYTLNATEAKQLCNLAKSKNLVGAIDFEFRYEDVLQQVKREGVKITGVHWRAPARVVTGWKADPMQGGGLTYEFASHVWDYLNWLKCPDATIDVQRGPQAYHFLTLEDKTTLTLYSEGWPDSRPACVARLIGDFLATINGEYRPDLPTFEDGLKVHERLAKVTG